MAVAYERFIARWPHFNPASRPEPARAEMQAVIQEELQHAANQVRSEVWGEQADNAIMLLAAHQISINPGGQFARLGQDASTNYLSEYERLQKQILSGDRVF